MPTLSLAAALAVALAAPPDATAPTWSGGIAAIVHARCSECHRPGGGAPFSLLSYEQVKRKASTIAEVVRDRQMPPWPATEGEETFREARRLSEGEIAMLEAWAEAGAPEGEAAKAPPPPTFASTWHLGVPDLEVAMEHPFVVPASGPDIYKYFTLPLTNDSLRWLSAIDIRSDAPAVVHHVLFYLDTPETKASGKAKRERRIPMGGWAVGMRGQRLPLGLGRPLPPGSDLVLQVHFHPSGKEERATVRVGMWFTESQPTKELLEFQLPAEFGAHAGLDIPAGDAEWRLRDTWRIPADIDLVAVWAHAHTVCRSAKATATFPDGSTRLLLELPRWSFDWQLRYDYRTPVRLPAGTIVTSELVYDNSAANPFNPHSPPARVRWGEQTTDEMGSLIFNAVAVDDATLPTLAAAYAAHVEATKGGVAGRGAERLFDETMRFDRNGDGSIARSEMPAKWLNELLGFDRNGDGAASADEVRRGLGGTH
jgi:mono/diheme cytochrome c family protein